MQEEENFCEFSTLIHSVRQKEGNEGKRKEDEAFSNVDSRDSTAARRCVSALSLSLQKLPYSTLFLIQVFIIHDRPMKFYHLQLTTFSEGKTQRLFLISFPREDEGRKKTFFIFRGFTSMQTIASDGFPSLCKEYMVSTFPTWLAAPTFFL